MKRSRRDLTRGSKFHSRLGTGQLEASSIEQLIQVCGDASRSIGDRIQSCVMLGQLGRRDSVATLMAVADSEHDPILVWEALAAVGIIGSRGATRPLIWLLRKASNSEKRRAIVYALSFLHDKRSRPALISITRNGNEEPGTRGLAAEALGLLRPHRTILAALLAGLEDRCTEVRYASLCGLGALGSPAALPAMKLLLRDDAALEGEGSVSDAAALAISAIESRIKNMPAHRRQRSGKRRG